MGAFGSTGLLNPPTSEQCIGKGNESWSGLYNDRGVGADGKYPPIPIDGCITGFTFWSDGGQIRGIESISINTIRGVMSGAPATKYYIYIEVAPGVNTGQHFVTKPVDWAPYRHSIGQRIGSILTVDADKQHALSGIRYNVVTACYNTIGIFPIEFRWVNPTNLKETDWKKADSKQPNISLRRVCGGSNCPDSFGGFTMVNDQNTFLIQRFNVNWGYGKNDGIFNIYNVSTLNLKALVDFTFGPLTPLITKNTTLDMTLRSDFAQLQQGFYREQLVANFCTPDKDGNVPKSCWCLYPDKARPDPDNNIYVARRLNEVKSGPEFPNKARPVCWSQDCREQLSHPENAKFVLREADLKDPCPTPTSVNICAVNIDVWESKDVKVIIDKMNLDCKFNQNNPPPGCLEPKNKDNPICKAYQEKPGPSPTPPGPSPGPSPKPPGPSPTPEPSIWSRYWWAFIIGFIVVIGIIGGIWAYRKNKAKVGE